MIEIKHGIYDIYANTQYNRIGYWNDESRTHISLCVKFRLLLARKGIKFSEEYGIDFIQFTIGTCNGIEVIAICQPAFDDYDEWLGEDIVIGRIERMRGNLQKIIYEKEEYEKKIRLYDIKDEDGEIIKTVYKIMVRKRVKLDSDNNPIVKRKIYYIPYDLNVKYPDIDHKDGTITYGELIHPYINVE